MAVEVQSESGQQCTGLLVAGDSSKCQFVTRVEIISQCMALSVSVNSYNYRS